MEVDTVEVVYRGLCERCSGADEGAAIDLTERADLRGAGAARPVGAVEHREQVTAVVRGGHQ